MMASIPRAQPMSEGSAVTAGSPATMAASSSAWLSTCRTVSPVRLASKAAAACSVRRAAMATSCIPGTDFAICSAMPEPMKPAPIIPTRIGRPRRRAARERLVDEDHATASTIGLAQKSLSSSSFEARSRISILRRV